MMASPITTQSGTHASFAQVPDYSNTQVSLPMQTRFGFADEAPEMAPATLTSPDGYKGLYGFHKYWGKKPHEPLAFIIERLTKPGDLVVDPFVGSGTAAREALLRKRRFIGFDINPVAIALSRLLCKPPSHRSLKTASQSIERSAKHQIQETYLLKDDAGYASHYLWEKEQLQQVWQASRAKSRLVLSPTDHDLALSNSFLGYKSQKIREPQFFSNGRINASASLSLDSIMTGRAQHNIDILISSIEQCDPDIQPYLRLCLTAASGQMTKMVFAVTSRGKTTGKTSDKIEVGSWVIGFWRPTLHFEVNVWNCFERRLSKLLKATQNGDPLTETKFAPRLRDVTGGSSQVHLTNGDAREQLKSLPDKSVSLLITDPPHSDRIPYLELSELWNSILNSAPDFDREIVVSNARERAKTDAEYAKSMQDFLKEIPRVLTPDGFFVLLYNARDAEDWAAFQATLHDTSALTYVGHFPCIYSAGSVVQDNRDGGLKFDYALVFMNRPNVENLKSAEQLLKDIPAWSTELHRHLQDKKNT